MSGEPVHHILHITAGSDAGGVSRYLHDLAQATGAMGHRITIAGRVGPWHDLFASDNIDWIDCPCDGGPLDGWRSVRMIRRRLAEQRISLIHAHYRKASLIGRSLARGWRIPLLFTLHMPGVPMGLPWRLLSDFGDRTHAISRQSADWLTQTVGLSRQRIEIIPHGVRPERFPLADESAQADARRTLALPAQATIAAFVGRYDHPKNADWILDLAQAACRHLPKLHLVMQGQGPQEPSLGQRAKTAPWRDRVTFLPYGDPLPLYRACDALLLPSAMEGFGLVAAEAMSAGRTVIRTATGGSDEQIVMLDGTPTGRATPIDKTAFIDQAIQTLADRAQLGRMGQAAARHVREHLSFDLQVQTTMALYQRLIHESGADRPPALLP